MTTTIEPSAAGLGMDDTIVTDEYTIGCMHTLDKTGDTRIMWDSRNKEEVQAAKQHFKDMLAKGYLAFKAVGKRGEQGEQIREFDKKAERIIFTQAMAGG